MRARLVVFPIKGQNWCFARTADAVAGAGDASPAAAPQTLKDLWSKISSDRHSLKDRAEIAVEFLADRMNRAWVGLENAPEGSMKSKLHSLGLRLLSRVKPSEVFLKSVSKDVMGVEIMYPASLNPRYVRRRLRHIAMRGCEVHRKYLYGSASLLPATTLLSILPMPNVPYFWVTFRTYSHWRALKGSERLKLLVSDCPKSWELLEDEKDEDSKNDLKSKPANPPWVLKPSDDLERLLNDENIDEGVSCSTIADICKAYNLDKKNVLKFKNKQ